MTATPIPRTMHMSIVGIRDMSVIYEPPQNRKPVQTYVLEYDKEVIKEAITYAKEKLQESNHNILKIKDYSIMKKENIGNKVKLKIFFSVIEDITKIEEIKVEY